jgi:hypothetical protein
MIGYSLPSLGETQKSIKTGINIKKSRREKKMLRRMTLRLTLFLTGAFLLGGPLVWAAESIISKVADPSGSACNLKFPAIREETLYWDRPVLKDPNDGDIIDFYGPCNYEPLGKESVARQKGSVSAFPAPTA